MAGAEFKSAHITTPVIPMDSKYDVEGLKATTSSDAGHVLDTIDPIAERKLVWKFDLRILPVLAVMYLFNSLDKVGTILLESCRRGTANKYVKEQLGQCKDGRPRSRPEPW
jgi:hypothetical protein